MSQNSRFFVSREKRKLLTIFNDLSRPRSFWKNLISVRSRYECSSQRSFWKDFIFASSSWKDLIFASSSWKDLISARSRYDYDSRYCIRLLYLSENDLSENDLSENDYDLFWISEILLFSQDLVRFSKFCEFLSFSTFFRLHFLSFLFLKSWIFSTRKAVVRSILPDPSQKESKPIRIDHIYIFLNR
jgi:hypothetical protein